jgi:hypothetical protein
MLTTRVYTLSLSSKEKVVRTLYIYIIYLLAHYIIKEKVPLTSFLGQVKDTKIENFV